MENRSCWGVRWLWDDKGDGGCEGCGGKVANHKTLKVSRANQDKNKGMYVHGCGEEKQKNFCSKIYDNSNQIYGI